MNYFNCIYKITNQINGKIYIGQTVNLKLRLKEYRKKSKPKITRPIELAIKKWGFENFKFEILMSNLTIDEMNEFEEYYIQSSKSLDRSIGYNVLPGGLNKAKTIEIKEKVSKSLKEYYKNNKHVNYGKKLDSHIFGEKISEALKEKYKKQNIWNKGKTYKINLTEEQRSKYKENAYKNNIHRALFKTNNEALIMYNKYKSGIQIKDLANEYKTSQKTISKYIKRFKEDNK